jgi:hypothetical protein
MGVKPSLIKEGAGQNVAEPVDHADPLRDQVGPYPMQ